MRFTRPASHQTWTFVAVVLLGVHARAQVTQRVSVASSGAQGNGPSGSYGISITADGRYVTFQSDSTDLVSGDTNGSSDIFIRDRWLGTTERVSVDSAGLQGNSASWGG